MPQPPDPQSPQPADAETAEVQTDGTEACDAPSAAPEIHRRPRLTAVIAALVVVVAAALAGWFWSSHRAKDNSIDLAVVYSPDQDSDDFLAGIRIAIAQINADGGLLDRPLRMQVYQEESYTDQVRLDKLVARTLEMAASIGKTKSVLAVIGHGSSATAVPASAVYDRYGKLFMATHATATSLSNHRLDLTFAMQPSNADNAQVLAEYARSQGWKRMVVLSDNSSYGIETTDRFRSALAQQGGTILHRDRLAYSNKSIDDLLLFILDNSLFKRDDIDAFFLTSSSQEDSARFITRARQLGLSAPILGPEYLYSHQIETMAGKDSMRDVVAVSLFDGETQTVESQRLAADFATAFEHPPGLWAAIGFDAVKVLTYATKRTGKLDPAAIADTLRIIRYEAPYEGATGRVVFDANGLVTDTKTYIVRHDGTAFHTVAAYRKPLDGNDENTRQPTASERKY